MSVNDPTRASAGQPLASADAPEATSQAAKPITADSQAKQPKLRLKNVLIVVVPAVVIAGAALAVSRFADVEAIWSDLSRPALVPAKGQVMYKGQPLSSAQVMTEPTSGQGSSALGFTDDQGKFSFKTDIRGNLVEGASVGEHRVTVAARENISVPGGPPLVTPEQYASMSTSPLRITVSSNPAENDYKFELAGEPPRRPGRNKGGGAPVQMKTGPPKGFKAKAKEESPPATKEESTPAP